MGKNEKTSKRVGKMASKGLRTGSLSKPKTKSVSASALTQRPGKSRGGRKK